MCGRIGNKNHLLFDPGMIEFLFVQFLCSEIKNLFRSNDAN